MKIVVHEDNTGAAPADHRFAAYDDDTWDGAPDSRNRHQLGFGPTPVTAVADLLDKLED